MCIPQVSLILALSVLSTILGAFDFQVSGRVGDSIQSYLKYVSDGVVIPSQMLKHAVLNISDGKSTAPVVFFFPSRTYNSVISFFYIGFENGLFYGYTGAGTGTYWEAIPHQGTFWWVTYPINTVNGILNSTQYTLSKEYVVTKRPWYIQGKATNATHFWSAPFADLVTGFPVISFVTPIRNATFNGKFHPFVGNAGANVFLKDISSYMSSTFLGTDFHVFIIDSVTLNLLGSSLGAATAITSASGTSLVYAPNSENAIIAKASRRILSENCPEQLVLMDALYFQCTQYVDRYPGIKWYTVILLPATLQVDHLGPESVIYNIVVGCVSATLIMIALAAVLCAYFWKTKMMQLSQPIFHLVLLTGCTILCVACLQYLGPNTSTSCATRVYALNIGFTLAFSPLLIKCACIYAVFVRARKVGFLYHGSGKKLIELPYLLLIILTFLCVEIVVLTTTLYAGGSGTSPYSVTGMTSNGAYGNVSYCGNHANSTFFYTALSFKLLQIVLACYFGFCIRRVNDSVAGTKVLMANIYNTAFIGSIILALTRSVSDIEIALSCMMAGILFCVIVSVVLALGPVLYGVVVVGDSKSAAVVIDGVFAERMEENEAKENKQSSHKVVASSNKSVVAVSAKKCSSPSNPAVTPTQSCAVDKTIV